MGTQMDIDYDLSENEPLGLIKSAEAIVGKIIPQYEHGIKDFEELPPEFIKVNDCLPQTQNVLNHAINELKWDESSSESIQPLAVGLELQVKKLQNVFTQVAKETKSSKDQTVLGCYITVLRGLEDPKSHQVEVLMRGILKDLDTLFNEKPLKSGYSKPSELKVITEKMSKVKSSVQESDLTKTGPSNVQNNYDRSTGHQYNGNATNINSGSGTYTINNNNGTNPTNS